MEARGISAGEGELTADVRGEVGKEDGVLVIRKVHVTYRVRAREEHRETVERVHAMHADRCPVYRTLKNAIDITTEYVLEADD
ncbi:MAG: hypothetical protein CME27_04780 [Gemmatimonadetes bacterium]|nr:hypothetical protein [Gemmatimonadota bacterium]